MSFASFTDTNFEAEVLSSSRPVLVDFNAAWCTACRALAPVVAGVADQYAGQLKVGTLDVDASPGVPTTYAVLSIPTLLLFKDGRVVGQLVGTVARSKIDALVRAHL